MICDLLRNDLSKIITKKLKNKTFEIQSHPTLHQMTSSVQGKLKNISLYQILKLSFLVVLLQVLQSLKVLNLLKN